MGIHSKDEILKRNGSDRFYHITRSRTVNLISGRAEIMNVMESGGLGGIFDRNPVVCRASQELIKILQQRKLVEPAKGIGKKT